MSKCSPKSYKKICAKDLHQIMCTRSATKSVLKIHEKIALNACTTVFLQTQEPCQRVSLRHATNSELNICTKVCVQHPYQSLPPKSRYVPTSAPKICNKVCTQDLCQSLLKKAATKYELNIFAKVCALALQQSMCARSVPKYVP